MFFCFKVQGSQEVVERRSSGRDRDDRLRNGNRQVGRQIRHPPLHVKVNGEFLSSKHSKQLLQDARNAKSFFILNFLIQIYKTICICFEKQNKTFSWSLHSKLKERNVLFFKRADIFIIVNEL